METRALHVKNLRALTAVELDEKVKELKKELFNLRFQFVSGRIESPAKIKQTRCEIARVLTILQEKQEGRGARIAGGNP